MPTNLWSQTKDEWEEQRARSPSTAIGVTVRRVTEFDGHVSWLCLGVSWLEPSLLMELTGSELVLLHADRLAMGHRVHPTGPRWWPWPGPVRRGCVPL